MAERPVFIPDPSVAGFVREQTFEIPWAGGFAVSQKKKNIKSLHFAAETAGLSPLLEASTKSDEKLGQRLSAFNLKILVDDQEISLESAYQGSKIFEKGGPYTDLYNMDARSAKRDLRLQSSGDIVGFLFNGYHFPINPKTAFYDWLYITAIFPHREWLDRLFRYKGFTDIEFNPKKSINCQARSCALFVSLKENNLLEQAVASPESFIRVVSSKYSKQRTLSSFEGATENNSHDNIAKTQSREKKEENKDTSKPKQISFDLFLEKKKNRKRK